MGQWNRQHTFDPRACGATVTSWHRSDRGITQVSGNVSEWDDQVSGDSNKNLTQGTAGSRPPYTSANSSFGGMPSLRFDGARLLDSGTWTSAQAQPFTEFLCGDQDTASNTAQGIYVDNVATTLVATFYKPTDAANSKLNCFVGAAGINSGVDAKQKVAACSVVNGASSAMYVNALTASITGTLTGATSRLSVRLGAINTTGLSPLKGNICERITVSGSASATIRQLIQRYLSMRYGVSLAL